MSCILSYPLYFQLTITNLNKNLKIRNQLLMWGNTKLLLPVPMFEVLA